MAVRQLRMFDDEILRKQCKEVTVIDEKVKCLIEDMGDGLLKLINPKIVAVEGAQECVEGCLSFPGRVGKTIRPQCVTIQALDENGKAFEMVGEGELAKCFCHEIDHLNGKLFLDEVIEFIDFNE